MQRGYLGDFDNGKISGSIPAWIKEKNGEWKSVTNLKCLFNNCSELIYPPKLPETSVVLFATFAGNTNLQKMPKIPEGVIDFRYCFVRDEKITEVIELPNSIEKMTSAFSNTGITKITNLPNNVKDLSYAFSGTKIKYSPNIPDKVENITCIFNGCKELIEAPNIGKNVKSMTNAFNNCSKLVGEINIYSEDVTEADAFLWETTNKIYVNVVKDSITENNIKNALADQTYYSNVEIGYI